MTLLICPVRPGDRNDELRFALRSWETNLHLGDDLELITVGHCPPWLKPDLHIEGNHYKAAPFAVFDNVLTGAESAVAYGGGDVVFMNDDFFCLDPVGSILPVRRNETLAEHLSQFSENSQAWWPVSLRLTAEWLADQGFPSPDSYEVHRPLLADADGMAETLRRWTDEHPLSTCTAVPQWRTVYGTLNKVDAHPVADAKLGARRTGIGTPWVSTSDQSWRVYARSITVRFQKPSRWED